MHLKICILLVAFSGGFCHELVVAEPSIDPYETSTGIHFRSVPHVHVRDPFTGRDRILEGHPVAEEILERQGGVHFGSAYHPRRSSFSRLPRTSMDILRAIGVNTGGTSLSHSSRLSLILSRLRACELSPSGRLSWATNDLPGSVRNVGSSLHAHDFSLPISTPSLRQLPYRFNSNLPSTRHVHVNIDHPFNDHSSLGSVGFTSSGLGQAVDSPYLLTSRRRVPQYESIVGFRRNPLSSPSFQTSLLGSSAVRSSPSTTSGHANFDEIKRRYLGSPARNHISELLEANARRSLLVANSARPGLTSHRHLLGSRDISRYPFGHFSVRRPYSSLNGLASSNRHSTHNLHQSFASPSVLRNLLRNAALRSHARDVLEGDDDYTGGRVSFTSLPSISHSSRFGDHDQHVHASASAAGGASASASALAGGGASSIASARASAGDGASSIASARASAGGGASASASARASTQARTSFTADILPAHSILQEDLRLGDLDDHISEKVLYNRYPYRQRSLIYE